MNMDRDIPRRRHRLTLQLEADTLDDLTAALHRMADEIDREQTEERESTSGGYSEGYHLEIHTDPEQTGDKYREQLRAWLRARKVMRKAFER